MPAFSFDELLTRGFVLHGASGLDRRKNGISPRRLPDWTRAQVPAMMDVMVRMPSGVRLVFETEAEQIQVSALATNMVTPPMAKRPVVFDLETDGKIYSANCLEGNTIYLDSEDRTKFDLVRGEPGIWRFDNLPPGKKHCELWLPHNAFVELHELKIEDGARLTPAKPVGQLRWVHYGSSISHCMEAEQPSMIWPAVASRLAGVSLQNLGFGGQCHLDPFVARCIRDSDADLISIKTGINIINMDSMRERIFAPLLHGFLDTIREKKPYVPITLISPIFCPSAEHHPGPTIPDRQGKFVTVAGHEAVREGSLTLSRVRQLIQEVIHVREDKHLHYIDGLGLFGPADADDLPDDLHPNPDGYVRMGQRFADNHLISQTMNLKED